MLDGGMESDLLSAGLLPTGTSWAGPGCSGEPGLRPALPGGVARPMHLSHHGSLPGCALADSCVAGGGAGPQTRHPGWEVVSPRSSFTLCSCTTEDDQWESQSVNPMMGTWCHCTRAEANGEGHCWQAGHHGWKF